MRFAMTCGESPKCALRHSCGARRRNMSHQGSLREHWHECCSYPFTDGITAGKEAEATG